ncbi:putative ABC transporter permease [Sedimentibacter sp. zth1]|uniref:putative ABC transporter permease n=1 Tax=Sedimentibacter sp. zth1 TaxID=2816908 RepID=UPI001A90E24A|nr:putative ABC transporter permease [Sedimentibacter sp. zth1]QSX05150.1 putative ABC transporter permease [Sedimentibacter sp. zth1]
MFVKSEDKESHIYDSCIEESMSIRICKLFLLFFATSMLGWIVETLYGVTYVGFTDRGLLVMPICPIYGVAFVIIKLILKTPETSYWNSLSCKINSNKTKFKYYISQIITYVLYFICATILTTLIELIIGLIIEKYCGVRLWDYTNMKYNLFGFVTPRFSIYWGLMATLFMTFVYPKLKEKVDTISYISLKKITSLILIILVIDITFSFGYMIKYGEHFILFKDFKLI